jgi:hypothetical protein
MSPKIKIYLTILVLLCIPFLITFCEKKPVGDPTRRETRHIKKNIDKREKEIAADNIQIDSLVRYITSLEKKIIGLKTAVRFSKESLKEAKEKKDTATIIVIQDVVIQKQDSVIQEQDVSLVAALQTIDLLQGVTAKQESNILDLKTLNVALENKHNKVKKQRNIGLTIAAGIVILKTYLLIAK